MTFQPLGQRVVLIPAKPEDKTKGGIIIPIQAMNNQDLLIKGIVKAISDNNECGLLVGDNVLFSSSAGSDIQIEDENYKIVSSDDIWAKL